MLILVRELESDTDLLMIDEVMDLMEEKGLNVPCVLENDLLKNWALRWCAFKLFGFNEGGRIWAKITTAYSYQS